MHAPTEVGAKITDVFGDRVARSAAVHSEPRGGDVNDGFRRFKLFQG